MTEKQVILFVRGEQSYDELEPETTELTTQGTMKLWDDGRIELAYEETELTGMDGTTTRFIVREDRVELTRTGTVSSQMLFQRGKRHTSLYETPWGMMLVDVATTRLAHRLGEHGGVMEIVFTIAVDHQVTGENRFKIRVKEAAK